MKFVSEIKTEPTLRASVAILVVAFCSASLASIAVYLSDPLTGKFCAAGAPLLGWPNYGVAGHLN